MTEKEKIFTCKDCEYYIPYLSPFGDEIGVCLLKSSYDDDDFSTDNFCFLGYSISFPTDRICEDFE